MADLNEDIEGNKIKQTLNHVVFEESCCHLSHTKHVYAFEMFTNSKFRSVIIE
jgi:hypothetical protein